MSSKHRKQVYPKSDQDNLRDTIQKLKSQLKKLQRENRELKSENHTLLDAWARTEVYLQEVTNGVPLEKIIKYKILPSENKDSNTEIDEKEKVRQKWANWRKENL